MPRNVEDIDTKSYPGDIQRIVVTVRGNKYTFKKFRNRVTQGYQWEANPGEPQSDRILITRDQNIAHSPFYATCMKGGATWVVSVQGHSGIVALYSADVRVLAKMALRSYASDTPLVDA